MKINFLKYKALCCLLTASVQPQKPFTPRDGETDLLLLIGPRLAQPERGAEPPLSVIFHCVGYIHFS